MSSSLFVVLVALCLLLVAAIFTLLWVHTRTQAAKLSEAQAQLANTSQQSHSQLTALSMQLAQVRAESKEEAERSRAAATVAYAAHLSSLQARMNEVLTLTQSQSESGRRTTEERLQHLSGSLTEQLGAQNKVMQAVQGQLGALGQAAKGMHELGRDIAGLQDILRAPKLRGNLGELFLAEILRQVLPADCFSLQHRFPSDQDGSYTIVDAVVHLGDRLVPIDSKFPLESFRRVLADNQDDANRNKQRKLFLDVVRQHIDDVAKKYIRPDANTYDFALAYLPAENVYYEAVVRDVQGDTAESIVTYAASKRVIPVSPSTLYAYLLTVAYGLRGMQIERQAETIRGQLAAFNKKFVAFYKDLERSGRNLDLAHRSHEDVMRRGVKLNDQVGKITGAILSLDEDVPGSLPKEISP
jgi:DNA recombination protein RmuC